MTKPLLPKALLSSILLFLLTILAAPEAKATLYSYCKVVSDNPEGGLVFASKSSSTPADSKYVAEMTTDPQSTGQFLGIPSSATHTWYIFAKANPGYVFAGWKSGSTETMDNPHEYGTTTYTTTSPGTSSTWTAHFIKEPAATGTTNLPYGLPKISPEENSIGDEVTVSYSVPTLPKYQHVKNVMVEFDHWEDENGNILSYDSEFKYTLDRKITFKAVIRELGGVPQVGKYYRIRCFSNRVLTMEGKYSATMPIAGGETVDPTLLRWALPLDFNPADFNTNGSLTNLAYPRTDTIRPICPEASPNTIFYIKSGTAKTDQLTKVVLESQGADTKTLTSNKTLDFLRMHNDFYGYFGFKSSAVSQAGFKMTYNNYGCDVYLGSFGESDPYCAMAVQPIDEEHMDYFWFGAKPDEDMFFEGGYWTSMYTGFPYECRDGVEAYYIKESATANGQLYAVLTRVDADRVPANSAVLLKCKSLDTKENRLLPLNPSESVADLTGNLLKGEFQLYTNANGDGHKLADANTRVLGINSIGEVGFYKLPAKANGIYPEFTANKAYLDLSSFGASATKAPSLKLIFDRSEAGLDFISADTRLPQDQDNTLYNVLGQPIAHPVPGQIYICNGEKIIYHENKNN